MKTFHVIGVITILTLLGFGYYLKTKQDEVTNKALIILLQNDEKTNKRVTNIGRTVYSKNAMVSKEDWDSHPEWQEHIDEKHTSYGNLCRKYSQFIENKNK